MITTIMNINVSPIATPDVIVEIVDKICRSVIFPIMFAGKYWRIGPEIFHLV